MSERRILYLTCGCYTVAVYLLLTILMAALQNRSGFAWPGIVLTERFHLASLYIPSLFLFGGFLIQKQSFPKRAVALLWASPVPFFTAVIMFQVMAGETGLLTSRVLIETLGRPAASVLFFLLLALEITGMIKLVSLLPDSDEKLIFWDEFKSWFHQMDLAPAGNGSQQDHSVPNDSQEDSRAEELPERREMPAPGFPQMPDTDRMFQPLVTDPAVSEFVRRTLERAKAGMAVTADSVRQEFAPAAEPGAVPSEPESFEDRPGLAEKRVYEMEADPALTYLTEEYPGMDTGIPLSQTETPQISPVIQTATPNPEYTPNREEQPVTASQKATPEDITAYPDNPAAEETPKIETLQANTAGQTNPPNPEDTPGREEQSVTTSQKATPEDITDYPDNPTTEETPQPQTETPPISPVIQTNPPNPEYTPNREEQPDTASQKATPEDIMVYPDNPTAEEKPQPQTETPQISPVKQTNPPNPEYTPGREEQPVTASQKITTEDITAYPDNPATEEKPQPKTETPQANTAVQTTPTNPEYTPNREEQPDTASQTTTPEDTTDYPDNPAAEETPQPKTETPQTNTVIQTATPNPEYTSGREEQPVTASQKAVTEDITAYPDNPATEEKPQTQTEIPPISPVNQTTLPEPEYTPVQEEPPVSVSAKLAPQDPPKMHTEPEILREHRPMPGQRRYYVPVSGVLTEYPESDYSLIDDGTRKAARVLEQTLQEFKIEANVTGIRKGPVITMFELLPSPGVKISSIVNLQDNIALRLAASRVRIIAPIPGKHAVGIEVPNKKRSIVSFSSLVDSEDFENTHGEIPVILGKDNSGANQVIDLTRTPHLLIAGATGSGKSVCVNSLIGSILYSRTPREVKMIMVDPKIVELKLYNDIPHLLTPVITDPKRALQALQWSLYEMERRYSLLDSQGVRDIKTYNRRVRDRKLATEKLPYIVVLVDEFADLMATSGKELEGIVARLAAMSRAVGIHLVLATQRPSVDVITGLIKANFPSRIAFMVAGKTDSRIIIDTMGAEKLLGRGDMLFTSAWDPFPTRMQGAFLAEEEVERMAAYVKTLGEPDYIDEEMFIDGDEESDFETVTGEDPIYEKALEVVVTSRKASASYLQRRLKIGYNRAARLVEEMEQRGIVGPPNGSKPRDIIHVPERFHGSPNQETA